MASPLLDTDLLLVNRSNNSYQITALDVKTFVKDSDICAASVKRKGISKTTTNSHRVLLGPNTDTEGCSETFVVKDRSSLYYQPNTDTLTVTELAGNSATSTKVKVTDSNANATRYLLWAAGGGGNNQDVYRTTSLTYNPNTNVIGGTITCSEKVTRKGISKTTTDSHRVLLGPNSNTAGCSETYVVTDRSSLYYQPSTDTLTVKELNGNAATSTKVKVTDSNASATRYILWAPDGGGNNQSVYRSTGLTYNPSTDVIGATAACSEKITRHNLNTADTGGYRLVLGEKNNNTGCQKAYVDSRTGPYYVPNGQRTTFVHTTATTSKALSYFDLGSGSSLSDPEYTRVGKNVLQTSYSTYQFDTATSKIRVKGTRGSGGFGNDLALQHDAEHSGIKTAAVNVGATTDIKTCTFGIRHDLNSSVSIRNTEGVCGIVVGGHFQTARYNGTKSFINGVAIDTNTIVTGGNNLAAKFSSSNGKFNFTSAHTDQNNPPNDTGGKLFCDKLTTSTGNYSVLYRVTGDMNDPNNFDEDGEYIGPVENINETIENLKQKRDELLSTVADLVARVEALESA